MPIFPRSSRMCWTLTFVDLGWRVLLDQGKSRGRREFPGGIPAGFFFIILCFQRCFKETFVYISILGIFSDFEGPMVPSIPLPPAPEFPLPPLPLCQLSKNRNAEVSYARMVLKHIAPSGLDIGYGNCPTWSERFPVSVVSEKTRKLIGAGVETVALADLRL